MIGLKTYMDHSQGTYACLDLCQESRDRLFEFIQSHIKDTIPKEEYHCTIAYSRKPVPHIGYIQPQLPIIAQAKEYALFNDEYFVLLLESNELHQLHKQTNQAGATFDYNPYQPHVSLSNNHKDIKIPVPDFPLIFDSYRVEPLQD